MKTQGEINANIRNGTVLVMTAAEFKQHIRKGDTITPDEVDVVTTGTFGVMSGTYAVLSIPVAEKKAFKNGRLGVAQRGPCCTRPMPEREPYGVIGMVMVIAAILVGLFRILPYSVTAAGIYLVGSIVVFLIFVYAFCAKCPLPAIPVTMSFRVC